MPNLIVCGDSFSYGQDSIHWPYLVAKKLSLNLINLSIVGCSNIAICYQILYAMKNYEASLFIVSLTAAERFEIDQDPSAIPASLEDFRQDIDEIKHSRFTKKATINSGNLISHRRNLKIKKDIDLNLSYRIQAQAQVWSINYLLSKVQSKYLLYRNIFPRYHLNKETYKKEYYFGLENYINSGPYDFESVKVKTTNHLSNNDNALFTKRVLDDYRINF